MTQQERLERELRRAGNKGLDSNFICHQMHINKYTSAISLLRKKLAKRGEYIVCHKVTGNLYRYVIEPLQGQRSMF